MASSVEPVSLSVVAPARLGALLLGLTLAAGPADALDFVVNSTLDTADVVLDGVCDSDPGVPVVCTLRAAIQEVNRPANVPPHTITFNILPLDQTVKTIGVNSTGLGALPTITQQVTIDGYTQDDAIPNALAVGNDARLRIELNGTATGAGVSGLTVAAPATVQGLVINRFAGNGIRLNAGSAGSVIRGNFVGTNVAGNAASPNNRDATGSEAGIVLYTGPVTIGGTAPSARNVVSGNNLDCSRGIEVWESSGNTIQGNYVGTNAAGTAALGNACAGIALDGFGFGCDNNLIGGDVAGAGNLLSGGATQGLIVQALSDNNTIQGNVIGLNAAGTVPLPNAQGGIRLRSAGNIVGGDTPAEGNVIAGNGVDGVRIENNAATGNAVVGNRIYGNGALGIDLAGDGVTNNDSGDGDIGPNNRLNFPVISAVSVLATSLFVSFSLDVPAGSYRVEFFRNPSGVDVPNGEGEVFAGFRNVIHGGGGSQSFSAAITGVSGDRITATTTLCTDGGVCAAFSDTSEFSANLIATPTNYRSIGTALDDSTGSVNTTNASQVVAGVGTSWLTINRGRGDVISICDQAFPTCTTSTDYVVLGVGSDTQLTLTTPYTGSTGNHRYTIRRQFRGGGNAGQALVDWENCIDGGPCTYFGAGITSSLVADNRREVGIAYEDSVFGLAADFNIQGSTTDASHTITLTADGVNRHNGAVGTGVVVDAQLGPNEVIVRDANVTIEWLELRGLRAADNQGQIRVLDSGATNVLLQNLLIHDFYEPAATINQGGIRLSGVAGKSVTVRNVMIWDGDREGISADALGDTLTIENCSIDDIRDSAGSARRGVFANATIGVIVRNTIVTRSGTDFVPGTGSFAAGPTSTNNVSSDATAPGSNPLTAALAANLYVNPGVDLHLKSGAVAIDSGVSLAASFANDIDGQPRQAGTWDRGADELAATILYRSVGNNGGAALASGGGSNALTIAGSTATFGAALANPNIGVGDVIQYNSNGALAFIHGRSTSQLFTVKDKDGNPPTAVAGDTGWFIYRAYRSLNNWESQTENASIVAGLRDFDVPAGLNLVTANTVMAVACYADANDTAAVQIDGRNTDASHYIDVFTPYLPGHVGATQRHTGTWASGGYALVANVAFNGVLDIRDDYVRVTGLRIENTHAEPAGGADQVIGINSRPNAPFEIQLSRNIIRATGSVALNAHDWRDCGLYQYSDGGVLKAWNNVIYGFGSGIAGEYINTSGTYALYNNTVANYVDVGIYFQGTNVGVYRWANNLVQGTGGWGNYRTADLQAPGLDYSSTNLSQDASAPAAVGGGAAPVNGVVAFVGAPDYHLSPGDTSAKDRGTNLSADPVLAVYDDIDGQLRTAPWDIGADDASGTTAVKLMSFEAVAGDAAVELRWRTGSELDNLGFHLYRALSEPGPWTRLTTSLIPGLGSSAVGRAYSYRDGGLVNGTRYFYRLDDVDASSKTTSHGPVSAVPMAGTAGSEPEAGGADAKKRGASSASCPDWVVAAYGSTSGTSASSAALRCTRHGDPEATSLGVVSRDSRQATLELRTGGFYALHEASGKVRVFVPGFDTPQDPQAPALPVRRALVDAVVGRRAQLGRVRALDQVGFRGLIPASLGKAEMQVSADGTVRAGRRAIRDSSPRRASLDLARLLPSVFQGETKSAVVEITPLRYDGGRRQIVLAKRVLVKLSFSGREAGESGRGRFGRRTRPPKPFAGELLARLYTTGRGLHAVSFEQLFPGRAAGLAASQLRLDRQGRAQGFHVAPVSDSFGPGSMLYFHADTTASSTDFSAETAWELLRAAGGVRMPLVSAPPPAGEVAAAATGQASFETNRFYQPGLLEAPDPWLWEAVASGATRAKSFSLGGVDVAASQAAELEVFLQGASESGNPVDHHVSVSLNGTPLGEAQFAGKTPYRMSLSVPSSVLHDGANELSLTNVADTGVSSMVFLDRFTVSYPRVSSLASGLFEGTWTEGGTGTLSGTTGPVALVDVTAASWLTGYETTGGALRFRAEAGHRYLAVSQQALLVPRIAAPAASSLRATTNQADYLLIAPRAFIAAGEPLLQRRQDQGLATRAVAFEEIADEFGHGQPSAEAIRSFLAFAFQSWARPSPRYVLLLGDSSYDPRNFMGTSAPSALPALWAKTSYLWTVSDPLLGAVNGEDPLPDLAIGRLPAATVEQAQALVEKLLAWEDSGQGLSGQATLVADNPDLAGDFEADVRDIAQSFLPARSQLLLLRELGAGTRPAIQDALNSGLSYLGYVGHGGAAVWASENVWNSWDAASLQAQSQQPLLVTMNCLNGYFVAPSFDSLSESLLKAEGRGAIAAFSPSGLSLDGPAHQYHRALMAELTSERHQRLGDAVLAAQKTYAETGLMPELLSVYQLLGDPAMPVR